MNRHILPAILLGFVSHVAVAQFSFESCGPVEVYQTADYACEMSIRNNSDRSVKIIDVRTADNDKAGLLQMELAPHETVPFTAHLNLMLDLGQAHHYFVFSEKKSGGTEGGADVELFVNSVLDQPRPELKFGVVELENFAKARAELELSSREVRDFRITGVVDAPPYYDIHVAEGGRKIQAAIKPDAPWGIHKDRITLAINSTVQPQVQVVTDVDVHGAVVPASNPYSMGLIRKGSHNEAAIRIVARDSKPLHLGRIRLDNIQGTTSVEPCIPKSETCRILKLVIGKDQPLGTVRGHVLIELPDYGKTLPVSIWALHLKQDAVVHDLDKEAEQGKLAAPSKVDTGPKVADLLKTVTKPSPAAPPGRGPLLKWQVSSDVAEHGYIVYRSDTESGEYLRVNTAIVPSEQVSGLVDYQWRDTSAEPGKTYWYYIGAVGMNGIKRQLSEPQKVVAK